jgi:hypothetical protein
MASSFANMIEEALLEQEQREKLLMQDPHYMQNTMEYDYPNTDMRHNPQSYETMNPPPKPSILDPMREGERYDDKATRQQYDRTERELGRSINQYPRTPWTNPTIRPYDAENFGGLFGSDFNPKDPAMKRLYNELPMKHPDMYSGQMQTPEQFQQYNVPKQYEQPELDTMQQLMQFYAGGTET